MHKCNALITRPLEYTPDMLIALQQGGMDGIVFPCLKITPVEHLLQSQLADIPDAQILIFISQAAVQYAFAYAESALLAFTGQYMAVGESTAKALNAQGIKRVIFPASQNSQGLVDLPSLQQLRNQRILIFSGVGGKTQWHDQLRQRGAQVSNIAVYQRQCPDNNANVLVEFWPGIDILTATSGETLWNLVRLLHPIFGSQLWQKPLLVISETMLHLAQQLGFSQIIQAPAADNAAIVKALQQWQDQHD